MKFGKQFEFYKIPEWSEYYFDYEGIKTVLSFLDKRRLKKIKRKKLKSLKERINAHQKKERRSLSESLPNDDINANLINTNENQIPEEVNSLLPDIGDSYEKKKVDKILSDVSDAEDIAKLPKDTILNKFMVIYKGKLKIVEEFFLRKLEELTENFDNLSKKISKNSNNLSQDEQVNIKRRTQQINAERDEMGYAVSWKRALSALYNETSWLHSFHSVNNLAIKKINKKIIKILKMNGILDVKETLEEAQNEFTFFNTSINKLVELRKKIKKVYSIEFTNTDIQKASKELESRLQGSGKIKHSKLIYFYLGITISCIFFLIILSYITPENDYSMSVFFPAFNFGLVIIESIIGVGFVVAILQKYRINYVYILEIDPKARLGSSEMFKNGLMMLTVWMTILLMFRLSLNFGLFNSNFSLFALIINLFLVIFLFLPFHIMYYGFRKGVVKVLIRNFFPIGKNTVRFKDFLFGDILTSLNKPFASLILGYCLMRCQECETEVKRISECNRETIPCLIVLFYPFFIRFTQCINRYYYTRQKWPHLGNTLKYVGGLSNAICAWLYGRYKTDWSLYAHIAVGIVSQSYMLFWDIYVDWGLGRCNGKNFFLRDKIVYPKKMYYMAIVIDAILRFSWTWNFIPIDKSLDEWKNLVTALLEAYRRIQWCVFRIENENWTNPENYRTILAIPELPLD